MIRKLLLILALVFTGPKLFSQRQSWNWYFGDHAALKFDSIQPPAALLNSAMTNAEGVASISDYFGNLLFYTDGITVYDSSHQQMQNGNGLYGNYSSTQSSIIVRKPLSDSLYYIFTVDFLGGSNGLNYSLVDMSLNGGKGAVTLKNILMHADAREKVTAIRHHNRRDFWVLVIDWPTDDLYAYLVDSAGVNPQPVISAMDSLQMQITAVGSNRANGYMKANRQGNKIAMALWNSNSFDLFDFNDSTGVVSNHQKLQGVSGAMNKTYGVEFSPEGTKLYGTTCDRSGSSMFQLIQFDLNAGTPLNIYNNRVILSDTDYTPAVNYYYGALQLGPDSKIYCSLNGETFLGVINYPDVPGSGCIYINNGVSLNGRHCVLGLPNFLADYALPIETGLQDQDQLSQQMNVFPNPATDHISVSTSATGVIEKWIIFNFLGNKVAEGNLHPHHSEIDLHEFANGMFVLQVYCHGIPVNKKILVNR